MRVSGWLYLMQQGVLIGALLFAAGRCAGLKRASGRRLTAMAMASAALTMALQGLPALPRTLCALTMACAAPMLAWPGVPRRLRTRLAVVSLLCTMLMAGALRSSWALAPSGMALTLLGCLLLCALPSAVPRLSAIPACSSVDIRLSASRVTLTALVDSGNLLRDAVTGLPVIVVSRRAAARLTPLPPEGKLRPGMRIIPVRTAAGSSIMTIFRPHRVHLLLHGRWQEAQAMIGISPDGYDGFQALVPLMLIQTAQEDAPAAPSEAINPLSRRTTL